MPTLIFPPGCLTTAFSCLFPTLDFSRIHFFTELPLLVNTGQPAITLTSGTSNINIYIRPEFYDPCDLETFLILAHELVHALQIQDSVAKGKIPGSWTTNYVTCYFASGFTSERGNCYEDEAYTYANGYPDEHNTGGTLRRFIGGEGMAPCLCENIIPWFSNPDFCTFVQENELVKTKADCTLGDCLGSRVFNPPILGFFWNIISLIAGLIAGIVSIFGVNGTGGGIGTIVGGIAGAIVGGIAGGIAGTIIGAIVGAIIGSIIGGIIDWIRGLFSGDDGGHLNLLFSTDNGSSFANRATFEKSKEHPALVFAQKHLFISWTGTNGKLNVLEEPGNNKSVFQKSNDCGPAITFDGRLWSIAWQGIDHRLNLMLSADGQFFANKVTFSEKSPANATPGLAFGNGILYLGWIGQDNLIYIMSLADGGNTQIITPVNQGAWSYGTCALAFGNGNLFLSWVGTDAHQSLNVITFQTSPDGTLQFLSKAVLFEEGSNRAGPALAFGNDLLFIAWTGTEDSLNVMSSSDGQNFGNKVILMEKSRDDAGPALAFTEGVLALAWTR